MDEICKLQDNCARRERCSRAYDNLHCKVTVVWPKQGTMEADEIEQEFVAAVSANLILSSDLKADTVEEMADVLCRAGIIHRGETK